MDRRAMGLWVVVVTAVGWLTGCSAAAGAATGPAVEPVTPVVVAAPEPRAPRPTRDRAEPVVAEPVEAPRAEVDDVGAPDAADETEAGPSEEESAAVGSRDPFNSDVVDRNREGEYIIERALAPVVEDEAPGR